jgi:glutamate racemase
MSNRPVLFLDSGIGCLPYAAYFHSHNPWEKLICVADRANFPYGPKSKETVIELVLSLTETLISRYDPKILAVVCNSAAVSALPALRDEFPDLPIVGTVPAVKPAVLASKNRIIGVLGPQRTIEDPYIKELSIQYGPDCLIVGEAATSLVEFVEHHWTEADKEERLLAVKPWVDKIRIKGADALVLACTHFLLLKEEFETCGGSEIRIFDSIEGVCHRVESLLNAENGTEDGRLRSGSKNKEQILLNITGNATLEPYWEKLASHFNIALITI